MISTAIQQLVNYGLDTGLILPDDEIYIRNQLLMTMQLDDFTAPEGEVYYTDLESILKTLVDDAVARGVCEDNSTARDLFDTKLMGVLTPRPSIVRANFEERYESEGPQAATDWFYKFSQDTDYIRRYRIKRDLKWVTKTPYGNLDITINLSKPEKDPKAIAAAKLAPQSAYPKCQLCAENEGYAGRMNHPARENHRIIPLTINDSAWNLQYSPYVYYNEHCIVLSEKHVPMQISRATFRRLLEFVTMFPHYTVGSNADLPIVGGSILTHEHYQGGCYEFAMARAGVREEVSFPGFEDVRAGVVDWPMSVIRLGSDDPERLVELADKVLVAWRGYSDASVGVLAETDGTPHNTITPIARRRGDAFELDLVLRNKHLIRKYEYETNILGIPVDRTDDWCLMTDSSGVVTEETVGGLNCHQMVGISYWSSDDGVKLAYDLDEVYRSPGGKKRYWEQVPMVYKKDNYRVHVRECAFEDITEIDTFNELKKIDKLYAI